MTPYIYFGKTLREERQRAERELEGAIARYIAKANAKHEKRLAQIRHPSPLA